jgi:hypothetical protein
MARKEDRRRLAMNALCNTPTDRQVVGISNLSAKGCQITAINMSFAVGQTVVLRPDTLESMAGTVKWASGQRAGIEFTRPLNPAVVGHLCQEHPIERRLKTVEVVARRAASPPLGTDKADT